MSKFLFYSSMVLLHYFVLFRMRFYTFEHGQVLADKFCMLLSFVLYRLIISFTLNFKSIRDVLCVDNIVLFRSLDDSFCATIINCALRSYTKIRLALSFSVKINSRYLTVLQLPPNHHHRRQHYYFLRRHFRQQ
jgi:hypothetical protein